MQIDDCITFRASLMELPMVDLMFSLSLLSNSLMSFCLPVVILVVSLASIFMISSSMGLLESVLFTCMFDILSVICCCARASLVNLSDASSFDCVSLGKLALLLEEDFSPVDLHLFLVLWLSGVDESFLFEPMYWRI